MKRIIAFALAVFLNLSFFNFPAYAGNKNFSDVKPTDWFYTDVQKLVDFGAISGFSDGTFKPQNTITRAEFIKILINSLKFSVVKGNGFADTKSHWASDSISTAISNGIIDKSEYGSSFEPEKPITRIEMAKMMLRALKVNPSIGTSPFVDVNDGYTTAAYNEYLISGSASGDKRYFYPNNNATRAEASAIVVRAVDYEADPDGYKAKVKEKQNTTPINTPVINNVAKEESEVVIENVSNLPARVEVNSLEDFKKKIMTAVYLKKSSLTLEVSGYNAKDYSFDNITKYISLVNFEKCFEKGYAAAYGASVSVTNNNADFSIDFDYADLDGFDIPALQKVRSINEFNNVIKNAVLNKSSSVTLALKNSDMLDYDVNKSLLLANNEETLSHGYYAYLNGSNWLDILNDKIINIHFSYNNLRYDYSSISKIDSYENFHTLISEAVKRKERHFIVAIRDYDSEKYDLGSVLYELNKDELSPKGYCSKVIYKNVIKTSPAIMEVYFDYPVSNGEYILAEDKDKPILRDEKEWYAAIKRAILNGQDAVQYNNTYSSDIGSNIISIVMDQNPDINYIVHFTLSSDGSVKFTYKFTKDKLLDIITKTNEKAKQVIAEIIEPNMSEVEKAKAIHDYIVKNTKYDYDNYVKDTVPLESYTAYGVLIKGTGVCQGYSAAFNLLAKMAGINSIGVSGKGKGAAHAWNMVKLDGKVGYVDVTWDDPVPDQGDKVRYNYFNISEEQIGKDHQWDKEEFSEKYLDY